MCTYPVQPVCTFLLHMVILIFIKSTVDCIAHFSSLHILLLILFYCFYLFFYLIPTYIYIYSPVLCIIFYFIFLHCPLSGPVLTYISLLIIPCMIVYVTNKQEPWTLNLEPCVPVHDIIIVIECSGANEHGCSSMCPFYIRFTRPTVVQSH